MFIRKESQILPRHVSLTDSHQLRSSFLCLLRAPAAMDAPASSDAAQSAAKPAAPDSSAAADSDSLKRAVFKEREEADDGAPPGDPSPVDPPAAGESARATTGDDGAPPGDPSPVDPPAAGESARATTGDDDSEKETKKRPVADTSPVEPRRGGRVRKKKTLGAEYVAEPDRSSMNQKFSKVRGVLWRALLTMLFQ
jgi:hypothetical protein